MVEQILASEHYKQFSKSPKSQVSGSDVLFCFISISKFGSFKNLFAMIASLSKRYFTFRRFILLVQMKKVIF